jgi:cytidylate kinase
VTHRRFTIAIDGPAAAGKSTVGAEVARRLDGVYFDTGLLYRAVTLAALRAGVAADDAPRLAQLAAAMQVDVRRPSMDDGRQSDVLLDGVDVTWELRAPEVDRTVSEVSAHPLVRAALLDKQRRIGRSGLVVMVGRDIGSVVLPDADLKVYLDASPEERARRRCAQLREAGKPADYATLLADIRRRDEVDSQRAVSPLRVPDGALVVDSD